VVKVDTHIHLAAAMTAKHLLTFIKRKLTENPNTVRRLICASPRRAVCSPDFDYSLDGGWS
jgi:hypothetical protein